MSLAVVNDTSKIPSNKRKSLSGTISYLGWYDLPTFFNVAGVVLRKRKPADIYLISKALRNPLQIETLRHKRVYRN